MSDLGFIHRYEHGLAETTLLLLHGTGGDENDLIPLGRELAPDANLLSPRGKVLENGMPRFFKRLAMGRFDLEDLAVRTDELAVFIDGAADRYGFDRAALVAVGFSNGANIAASLLLRHPGKVLNAALLHALLPFEPDARVDLGGTSVLITSGSQDTMIPSAMSAHLAEELGEFGADVEHAIFPGGHNLSLQELETAKAWLEKVGAR
jgi:phospholipase/carboxylesterase